MNDRNPSNNTTRRNRPLWLAAGLGLLISAPACVMEEDLDEDISEPGEMAAPIHGGVDTEDADLRAVVEVLSSSGGKVTHCTGTLVTEDVVVTAAHCVCEGATAYDCNDEATVYFSGLGVEDDPDTYFDESNPYVHGDVVVHPSYYFFGSTVQNDIALVLLKFPFEDNALVAMVKPINVAKTAPKVGQSLELVGFGFSNDACTSGAGVKRKVNMNVATTSGDRFTVVDADAHTCPGDSGGPALDSQGRLVGVLSSKPAGDIDGPSTYMQIAHFLPFLSQNACAHDEIPVNVWDTCRNPLCPCMKGEGDCDSHAECDGALICVNDVGPSYGLPLGADVCEQLAAPSLHVEFIGCKSASPQFSLVWGHSAGAFDTYDVDLKQGYGSYQSYYNGASITHKFYAGSSSRNDSFRVRVCRQGSCSKFISRSTGKWNCTGTGGGGGTQPL